MKLTHAHVRHLYWSICSQELAFVPGVSPLSNVNTETVRHWCIELDQNPEPLETYIAQREHRLLGSYFEVLWQFFFTHFSDWQLLGSRIQIPPTGPTLGELDILCLPPNKEPLHVELAIKVYLQHPDFNGSENHHWLGPRTNDRLDLKLDKLHQKQFRMLEQPATQETLNHYHLPLNAGTASVIKGYLFRPFLKETSNLQQASLKPDSVNPDCHNGHWIHANQVQHVLEQHSHWQIIDKWQWLGPFWQIDKPLTSRDVELQVARHFTQPNYALMLVALQPDVSGDLSWTEKARFMVVNNRWPEQSK